MKHSPTSFSTPFSCLALGSVILLAMCLHPPFLFSSPQSIHPRQNLHSVLSQSLLTPPLRSPEATLHFSPNGKYLLLQDASGIAIFSTTPLAIVLYLASAELYPAQFSADSGSFTIVSRGLSFATWKLPEGKKVAAGDLLLHDECLDGQLSPDGQYFACITSDLKFILLEIPTQKSLFEDSLNDSAHFPPGTLRSSVGNSLMRFIPLDSDSALARPFGLIRTNMPRVNAGRSLSSSSIYFSSDAKVLIVNSPRAAFGLDVTTRKKFDVSDRFQKMKTGEIALQDAQRAVVIEEEKDKESKSLIVSPKNGKVLATPQFTADSLRIASNSRYVILQNSGKSGAAAFDLSDSRLLEVPHNASMDVLENRFAIYNNGGFVALYRLADRQLLSSLRLPLIALPVLSAASVTPGLEQLAISVGGEGAIFQVSSGQRSSTFEKFTAANFSGQQNVTLLQAYAHHDPPRVLRVNVANGETSPAWDIPKNAALHSNGPVLLEYSFSLGNNSGRWDPEISEAQLPFRLRALDPSSGNELWKRNFGDNAPTPFADPQGDRLVLGWKAKSWDAKEAAAHNPAIKLLYKNAKLTDQDSFFEALDARTGKSLGGILVQVGSRPISFDSAFSVGDTMVLVKDSVRVSLYSLADGLLKAHLVGAGPCLSAESNLLALYIGSGRLGIYDTGSGAKLDQQLFPDDIAYSHFSSDGKRLFVLTEHQATFILDVSKVREAHPENPPSTQEKN